MFTVTEVAFIFAYALISLAFGAIPYLSLGIIPVFLLGVVFSLRYVKRSLFRNLREAAAVGGRQALLDVLVKIDSLGIVEVEQRKGLIGRLWPIPSITDRIEYLRKLE